MNERKHMQRLLTPKQAAALAGVHVDTITRWRDAGYLTATRTRGGHHRYDEAEIHAWRTATARAATIRPPTDRAEQMLTAARLLDPDEAVCPTCLQRLPKGPT